MTEGHAAAASGNAGMKRNLGLVSATTLIVGSAIGSGIFLLPSRMAGDVGSPGLLMVVWVVCGLVSLFGALTFAEMAAMYPRAGGQYLFLREAYDEKVAFLYGWTFFWVIQTGIIAAVATAFALFMGVLVTALFPGAAFGPFAVKATAVGCILLLSTINFLGVKYGGVVQNVFTFLKVGAIAAIVVATFALTRDGNTLVSFESIAPAAGTAGIAGGFGLAMLAAFFAYDGWNQAAFVASEVKDPQRTVPKAMFLGVFVVMAVYMAATAAFVYGMPFGEFVTTATPASSIMEATLGPNGLLFVTVAIVVSTFGTVNAFILSGPRVYYAMAKEGLFYKGMSSVHKRFRTPDFATVMQAEWACLLVLTGTYDDLVNYATFGIWAFYGLTGVGLFVLRRRAAHLPRPYKTWGYPVVPILFIAAAAFVVVNTIVNDTRNAGMGLLLIATGLPFLWFAMRRSGGMRRVPVEGTPGPAESPTTGEAQADRE